MHIKEAYQRRIKQQSSPRNNSKKIDHSQVIGSIHTGNLNYSRNQPFFIDSKVRDELTEAKNYIKRLKDADILELKEKRQWNPSVSAPRKFSEFERDESHKTKLLKIKLGFSDFSPLKETPNKMYQGTETRNDYTGWNVSTYFDKKQKSAGVELTNLSALDNTINYNKNYLANYKTLSQRYKQAKQQQKLQIINNSDIIQDLKQSYRFTNPNSSLEKTNASVKRMWKQLKLQKIRMGNSKQQFETQDSFSNFRARLSPTQKQKIKYVYFHTGCWQEFPRMGRESEDEHLVGEGEGGREEKGFAWTCCHSSTKDGRGCSFRVHDGNKMNLSSFSYA